MTAEMIRTSEAQIADIFRSLAKRNGEFPKMEDVRAETVSPRGGHLSARTVYYTFERHGDCKKFGAAYGVFPAVIVDGVVYSAQTAANTEPTPVETTAVSLQPQLEALPSHELIALGCYIAELLSQRAVLSE